MKRIKEDTEFRQNNNKTINDRIKLIDDSTKRKIHFNNKQDEKDYFDSFYNKQIEYKKTNKKKLEDKYKEENKKNNIPEKKNKNNLNNFKNNEPMKLSKNNIKDKNTNNNNQEDNMSLKVINENETNPSEKIIIKKRQSFGLPTKTNSINSNNPQNNITPNNNIMLENNNNEIGFNNRNKILKKVKSDPSLMKNKIKLSQKEIEELTNKLHYDGELLKIKKQAKIAEELTNNSIYNNFSKENLNRSSIFILIKKILYEYSTSVKKNTFIDYTKNPKLNYEQYTDIMKDLYYLDKDALPEDYLEENTMYKELWNKLKRFSIRSENL